MWLAKFPLALLIVSWALPTIFYRFSLTPTVTLTPDLQVLIDPALNPDHDVILILGLRARINF